MKRGQRKTLLGGQRLRIFQIGERYRRFSPREAANIQSFPNNFKLDSVSDNRQYRAIGNAVPPVLMWNVANALISNIQILANSNKRKLSKKIK
jgi:site-specific DNA-cytosine methylase